MRFFCRGSIVEWDSPRFEPLLAQMSKERIESARAIIMLDVWKVQTSCGYGVPFLALENSEKVAEEVTDPDDEDEAFEVTVSGQTNQVPVMKDRATMGHWGRKMIDSDRLMKYQVQNNSDSLDGLTGLRAARRQGGERILLGDTKQKVKDVVVGQWEGVLAGWIAGAVLMWIFTAYL
jgi:hypothetical protein